jgi:hypothetical protein
MVGSGALVVAEIFQGIRSLKIQSSLKILEVGMLTVEIVLVGLALVEPSRF